MTVVERWVPSSVLDVSDVLRRESGLARAVHLRAPDDLERRRDPVAGADCRRSSQFVELLGSHKRQREVYALPRIRVNTLFWEIYVSTITPVKSGDYALARSLSGSYSGNHVDENRLGANIERLRREAGHTNATAFAEAIGVTATQLHDWETGRYKNLSLESLIKIAQGIPCTVEDLLQGTYEIPQIKSVDAAGVTTPDTEAGQDRQQSGDKSIAGSAAVHPSTTRSPLIIATELREHASSLSALADDLVRSAAGWRHKPGARRKTRGPNGPPTVHPGAAGGRRGRR